MEEEYRGKHAPADYNEIETPEESKNAAEMMTAQRAQRYGSRLRNFFRGKERNQQPEAIDKAENKNKGTKRERLVRRLKKSMALACAIVGLAAVPRGGADGKAIAETEVEDVPEDEIGQETDWSTDGEVEIGGGKIQYKDGETTITVDEPEEEEVDIRDLIGENYQIPDPEVVKMEGVEFIVSGTKEIEGFEDAPRTFIHKGGYSEEADKAMFYANDKRQPYANTHSYTGETSAERFEEWEMALTIQPKALAEAIDQFDLEEKLGIEEFGSCAEADAWAESLKDLLPEEYDKVVNNALAEILGEISEARFSRNCVLGRDMHDIVGSSVDGEGTDEIETFGNPRGNRGALQMTFYGEDGSNVCSSPDAFKHVWDTLSAEQRARLGNVGSVAWVNIGEYGEGNNGGLGGNWEYKEGARESSEEMEEEPEKTPEPTEEPTPDPDPTPTPEPDPDPTPTPEPDPDPTPTPTPEPDPDPTPTPTILPPDPTPTTTPPAPTPTTAPTPTPTPTTPPPTPTPTPESTPKPKDPENEQAIVEQAPTAGEVTQTNTEDLGPVSEKPERDENSGNINIVVDDEGAAEAQEEANKNEQTAAPGFDFTPEELAQMEQDLRGGN